jgi:hypothetical protein
MSTWRSAAESILPTPRTSPHAAQRAFQLHVVSPADLISEMSCKPLPIGERDFTLLASLFSARQYHRTSRAGSQQKLPNCTILDGVAPSVAA